MALGRDKRQNGYYKEKALRKNKKLEKGQTARRLKPQTTASFVELCNGWWNTWSAFRRCQKVPMKPRLEVTG